MKKRLLPLLLALVMAFSMTPMASADFYLEYPHLEIGTEGVFDFTPETNPPLNKNTSGQGWSWNAATYTLTLNGVNQPKMDLYITDADKPVTIVVNGTNTLRTFGEISVTSVVDVTSTMIGSGTLNLKGYSGSVDVANGPTGRSRNSPMMPQCSGLMPKDIRIPLVPALRHTGSRNLRRSTRMKNISSLLFHIFLLHRWHRVIWHMRQATFRPSYMAASP